MSRSVRTLFHAGVLATAIDAPLLAQQQPRRDPVRQTEADAYTRYELLAPGSGKFRITYEVTATTAGATEYFNPIRTGSIATDESVVDRASGLPLRFDVVGASVARAGGVRVTDTTQHFIRVHLAHRVPAEEGEGRMLILKTYEDATSYFLRGDTLVFTRPLGIKRNAIVLPLGYELVTSSFPAQLRQEEDGRIGISFWNATPSEAAVSLRAVPRAAAARPGSAIAPARLGERARQNREIVYLLQQPETHAFDLYHDYTESRAGLGTYLNVVRAGSAVSNPRGMNLDTGDPLHTETVRGSDIARRGLDTAGVESTSEVVIFGFTPAPAGGSVRIRMFETYTDSARYRVIGDELVWERSLGRPANAVVLPAGWLVTNSTMPATISTTSDGRIRLDFINPRPDELTTIITARRR